MKRVLVSTALLLALAPTLAACGDDEPAAGDAPSDASAQDFCDALRGVAEGYFAVSPEEPTEDEVRDIKQAVADLVEVGTPEDMSDDERAGFTLVTDSVLALEDDATRDELESAGEEFSGADEEKADAFDDYVDQTCEGMSGDDE